MNPVQAAADAFALAIYPGALACAALAIALAAAHAVAPGGGLRRTNLRGELAGMAPAAVLAGFAAVQSTAPLNLLPPGDRNLLAGVVALVAASWVAGDGEFGRGRLLLQAAWAAAMLAPALEPQTLRPEAIGSLLVPGLVAVKIAAVGAALIASPALVTPGSRGGVVVLPAALLLASVAVPPAEGAARAAAFLLATALAAAAMTVLGRSRVARFPLIAAPVLLAMALAATVVAELPR